MDGQNEKFSNAVEAISLLSKLIESNSNVENLTSRILHIENKYIDLLSGIDKLKVENSRLIKEALRSKDHQCLHKALAKVSNQKETLTNLNLAYSRVCDERDTLKRKFVK
mgnify:CR=1 FL=1